MISSLLQLAVLTTSVSSADLDVMLDSLTDGRMACGPRSVWFVLGHFGHKMPIEQVEKDCRFDGSLVRVESMLIAARRYEPRAHVCQVRDRSLARVPLPAILVIDDQHCVVLSASDGVTGEIFEPTTMRCGRESIRYLESRWTGEALVFTESPMSVVAFVSISVGVALLTASFGWLGYCRQHRRAMRCDAVGSSA